MKLVELRTGFGAVSSISNLSTPNMSTNPAFFSSCLKLKKVIIV